MATLCPLVVLPLLRIMALRLQLVLLLVALPLPKTMGLHPLVALR